MAKKKPELFSEFTVLGVFVAVAVVGLLYAAFAVLFPVSPAAPAPAAAAPLAPTVDQYKAEAVDVLSPFLTQARTMTQDEVVAADPTFVALVGKTEDRLFGMRVPSSMRDAHLSFVLLLEQWKRAESGSTDDQNVVLQQTAQVVSANPWLSQ